MAYKVETFINAIPGTGGNITAIKDKIGCDWHTVKRAIEDHPTVARAYEQECHKVADKARYNVHKAIFEDGDLATSKWYLMVKDPEFTPKQESKHSGSVNVYHVNWDDDPDNPD